jgi:hypothetical protein
VCELNATVGLTRIRLSQNTSAGPSLGNRRIPAHVARTEHYLESSVKVRPNPVQHAHLAMAHAAPGEYDVRAVLIT